MRQFTIAERLSAVLLPLAAIVSVPFLTAALMPFLDEANATFVELLSVTLLQPTRGELAPHGRDRQACDVIGGRQHRELVSSR